MRFPTFLDFDGGGAPPHLIFDLKLPRSIIFFLVIPGLLTDNDPPNRCKLLGRLYILRANCFKADKAAKKREKEVFDYTQNVLITFNIIWLCEWLSMLHGLSEPSAGTHCLFSLLAPVHKSRSAPPKCHLVAR